MRSVRKNEGMKRMRRMRRIRRMRRMRQRTRMPHSVVELGA